MVVLVGFSLSSQEADRSWVGAVVGGRYAVQSSHTYDEDGVRDGVEAVVVGDGVGDGVEAVVVGDGVGNSVRAVVVGDVVGKEVWRCWDPIATNSTGREFEIGRAL